MSIQPDFLLAGKTQSATKVMFYNTTWLQNYYCNPYRNNQISISRAIGFLHCFHCDGISRRCSCTNGCPQGENALCRNDDSTASIDNFIAELLEALTIISSPPENQDPPRVTAAARHWQREPETHNNVFCDGCSTASSVRFISGKRFKCKVCDDYDLCENCYSSNVIFRMTSPSSSLLVRSP